jgi:FkbM family methyltransferase
MTVPPIIKSVWCNPGNRNRRLRKSCDALIWQLRKRTIHKPRMIRLVNGIHFIAYPDCVVSSALVYTDWPEYYELMFIRKQLCSSDVVLDVGAYVGHISLLLADIINHDQLFAFEPAPSIYQRLKENWQANNWSTGNLFQVAIGAESGSVFIDDHHPNTMNAVTQSPNTASAVAVPLVCLDDYFDTWNQSHIGLIKIDVEGYEYEVFKGARKILQHKRPRLIMFESLQGKLDTSISHLLTEAEYEVFQLGLNGEPDFSGKNAQNLFAVPKESLVVEDVSKI